jgi:hypothetical protein
MQFARTSLLPQAELNVLEGASSSCFEMGITDENENQNPSNIKNKIFYQFIFLEHIFRESKELVVLRPGSETLWSHMRATADLILTNVPRILNEKRREMKISENSDENTFLPPDSAFLIFQEDFEITLNYSNVLDNQQNIEKEEKQIFEGLKSDDSFQYLNLLQDQLNSEYVNNKEVNFLLLMWLVEWLKKESNFCQNCIDNFCAWNHANHIRMSLRYYCFVLSRILLLYDMNTFQLDDNDANYLNRREVDYSVDEESRENLEQNITCKKIKMNDNSTCEQEKMFSDYFSSFIAVVRNSLKAVSKQIQSEGEL